MRRFSTEEAPGEWIEERNRFGGVERYRIVGGIKEYDMKVQTTDGVFYQSELDQMHREPKPAVYIPPVLESHKACPLSEMKDCACDRCAMYQTDGECALTSLLPVKEKAGKDTKGNKCPFDRSNHPCTSRCIMYNGGCTIPNVCAAVNAVLIKNHEK